MEWQVVVALIVAIPVILVPVIFVWFVNAGGLVKALRARQARQATKGASVPVQTDTR